MLHVCTTPEHQPISGELTLLIPLNDHSLGELECWLDWITVKSVAEQGEKNELCWYFKIITRNMQFYAWNSCAQYLIIPEIIPCSKWKRWQSFSNRYVPVEFSWELVHTHMWACTGGGCGKPWVKRDVRGKHKLQVLTSLPREDWAEWLQRSFNIALGEQINLQEVWSFS